MGTATRAPGTPTRLARALADAWIAGGCVLLAALVAVRWLRYAPFASGPRFDPVLRELMVLDVDAFVWPWVYTTLKAPIVLVAAALVVVALHRRLPAHVVGRVDGVLALTPVAAALLVAALLWLNYLVDLNMTVARVGALSLLLLAVTTHPRLRGRLPPWTLALAWTVVLLPWLVVAGDWVERLAVAVWSLVVAAVTLATPHVRRRDLGLAALAALVPVNLLTTLVPLALPLHGGTWLGAGLGYNFCEVPGRDTVYATVPVCDSVKADYEDCRDGAVVEYDRATKQLVARHRFMSPAFHGRLELLACLPDEVHVAVQAAVIQGRAVVHSALAFPVADPTVFNPAMAGPGVGVTLAYDQAHEAMFYSAEFTHRIVRLDRRTQRLQDVASAAMKRHWIHPITLETNTGSNLLYTASIHPRRNRIYVVEWLDGREAKAIDLDTLEVVARYEVGSGGALGITVDPDRDRLIVSSVWGIEVFDLATDRLLLRRRMGFGNRAAVLDRGRNRLYVGSTVDGRIRILDRDTYDVIGQIPVGIGTRFAYLSRDGTTLYASSTAAHFYWDDATLGPRMRE